MLKNISVSFFFLFFLPPPSLLPFLPGCSIIHRQYKSGLAQQGAFQLATYSYGAVKVIRNYMMYEKGRTHANHCTHSDTRGNFRCRSSIPNICLYAYSMCAHTMRGWCLHTSLHQPKRYYSLLLCLNHSLPVTHSLSYLQMPFFFFLL